MAMKMAAIMEADFIIEKKTTFLQNKWKIERVTGIRGKSNRQPYINVLDRSARSTQKWKVAIK